jgi:DNA integrity scanning protein DisA with diadenylate cyclase activity
MSQKTGEIESYVKRVGEHINAIYLKLNEISKKMDALEEKLAKLKDDQTNDANAISDLKVNTVPKTEFDEFVNRLTESLRELLPPVETEETTKEE